jgi:thymidylate synthase ThyX
MTITAKILADSINPHNSIRLTTFELKYPRFIHAEFMTHRMFSRNASSSRAIPTRVLLEQVESDPAMPVFWGKNEAGMQANESLEPECAKLAELLWRNTRHSVIAAVKELYSIGLHKQTANRLLEPWQYITVICTATEWANFFALRDNKAAQPEMRILASKMKFAMVQSSPKIHHRHTPLTPDLEELLSKYDIMNIEKISAGRCARVSYLTHDGVKNPDADIELANRLIKSGHMSPFEHVATSVEESGFIGNFRGWKQLRKEFANEAIFQGDNQ